MAIPFNLLLWGSESCATNLDVLKELEVFHIRYIRSILSISWDDLREEKISNLQVRKRFNISKNVELWIAKRRLTFLGKIIRMSNNNIPTGLLSAACKGKRLLGRPNTTTRHSTLKDIRKIVPEVDNKGSFSKWANIANNILAWSILIINLGSKQLKPTPEWDDNTLDSPNYPFPSASSENKNPWIPPQVPPSPPPSPLKILFRVLNLNPTSSLRGRIIYLLENIIRINTMAKFQKFQK